MRRRLDMLLEPVGEQDISESNGTSVVNDVGVDVEIPYNNETTIRSRRCFDRPFKLVEKQIIDCPGSVDGDQNKTSICRS